MIKVINYSLIVLVGFISIVMVNPIPFVLFTSAVAILSVFTALTAQHDKKNLSTQLYSSFHKLALSCKKLANQIANSSTHEDNVGNTKINMNDAVYINSARKNLAFFSGTSLKNGQSKFIENSKQTLFLPKPPPFHRFYPHMPRGRFI